MDLLHSFYAPLSLLTHVHLIEIYGEALLLREK